MKSKLYNFYQGQKDREYAENRKLQVGTGDRSEKIRTYNYPQSRVTDHRINLTIHSLEYFMDGDDYFDYDGDDPEPDLPFGEHHHGQDL